MIFAIDPGSEQSAFVIWDHKNNSLLDKGIVPNAELLKRIEILGKDEVATYLMPVEMIACYGMAVGKSVFETLLWIGKFLHAYQDKNPVLVYRKDVKIHHCNSMKAKDSNIRQVLIDRFGEVGTKKNPGKLYGISKDMWSALAIATYYGDLQK